MKEQRLFRQLQVLQGQAVIKRLVEKGVKLPGFIKEFKFEVELGRYGARVGLRIDMDYYWYDQDGGDWLFDQKYSQKTGKVVKTVREGMKGIEKAEQVVDRILKELDLTTWFSVKMQVEAIY